MGFCAWRGLGAVGLLRGHRIAKTLIPPNSHPHTTAMKKFPSLLALTAALFVPVAQAELTTNQVFNVNFADGNYTNGRIVVTNLGINQGGWQQTSTVTNNGPFITNNNQAVLPSGATGQDIWKAFTSNTIVVRTNNFGGYLQTKINFSITNGASTNGDYFFHLSTITNTTSGFPQRLFAKSDGSTNIFLGISASSSTGIYGTNPLSLNTTYNAVIQWSFSETNNDTLSLFVDPTDPILTNNAVYAATAFSTDVSSVAAANLRIGGGATTPGVLVNSIEVGTVVPEPSTYAMLALAGAGFAGYVIRRRRR
jgi:hypothetical protein